MNTSVPRRRWALALASVAVAIAATAAPCLAQERFSALTGTLKDDTGAVLPGVTVSITNKQTGKVYTVVTGSDGGYRLLDLEPGRYSVRFELTGFSTAEQPDVNLLLGKTLELSPVMAVGGVNEAITVSGESPLIDARSTTIAHNVTAEEIDRIPKGRSFQNLAISSPSVNAGEVEGGIQVNGASGSENAFTIDGVVTNSLVNGAARQDAVFEYLQEVQVKTGGISAEYGGALGGVISAVTKSGGNTFHGEGHYYFSGSPLNAAPVKRLVLDPRDDVTVNYYQDVEQDDFRNEVGGSVGGPILRDKLFFFASVRAAVRRPHERLPLQQRGRGGQHRPQPDVHERVREGQLRPEQPAAHQHLDARDADEVYRFHAGVRRHRAECPEQHAGGERAEQDARLRAAPVQLRGHGRPHPDQQLAPERARRVLRRQLHGHRHPADEPRGVRHVEHRPRLSDPRRAPRRRGVPQHPARADQQVRSHQARVRELRLHPVHQLRRPAQPEGRLRRAAHLQRRGPLVPRRRLRHGVVGSLVREPSHRAHRSRPVRLLPGGRHRHARQGRLEHPVAVRPGPVDDQQPADPEPRAPHRTRDDPVVQAGHPGHRLRIRLAGQAVASARRKLRLVRRWPAEAVWQLGTLHGLDEVRAGARRVRRRHLVRALPLARHDRRVLAQRREHARPQSLVRRAWQLPGSPRAEFRHGGPEPEADEPGRVQRGQRIPAQSEHRVHGELRAQRAPAHD